MNKKKSEALSAHAWEEIDEWLSRYPADRQQSALLAALRIAQHENHGYLTVDLMDAIAFRLNLPPIAVYEVATFYSMYETKPVGRHHVAVCTNISCMLRGSDEVLSFIEKKLGISLGESTSDGRIYLKKEEECLAACAYAPMMQVDHVYYENLTAEKVEHILDSLE